MQFSNNVKIGYMFKHSSHRTVLQTLAQLQYKTKLQVLFKNT